MLTRIHPRFLSLSESLQYCHRNPFSILMIIHPGFTSEYFLNFYQNSCNMIIHIRILTGFSLKSFQDTHNQTCFRWSSMSWFSFRPSISKHVKLSNDYCCFKNVPHQFARLDICNIHIYFHLTYIQKNSKTYSNRLKLKKWTNLVYRFYVLRRRNSSRSASIRFFILERLIFGFTKWRK